MSNASDRELVREFSENNSEAAFSELVSRHINLVYSVALRYVGNVEDSQDVTQAVFIILAKKAASLRERTVLTGWLYETTRLTAAGFLRARARRQRHEQEAVMESTLNESASDSVWQQLAPHLEDAMSRMGESDRALLALRYFENKTGAEAAALLGIGEAAAHKRTLRALERLRSFFMKRGIAVSAVAIVSAVSANSVQAAPAGLAMAVSAAAAAKGATAGGSTLALVKGALKIMAWTKAKMALGAGVGVLLAAGTTTVAIKEFDDHKVYEWQKRWDFEMVNKMPPQATIRSAPLSRDASVHGAANMGGKMLGLGLNFNEMVQEIYQTDQEHLIVRAPFPKGKFDYIVSFPDATNVFRSMETLNRVIRKQFGVSVRRDHVETNVLILAVQSTNAPGLKLNSDPNQSGPIVKEGSIFCHSGIWKLVQALEDNQKAIVVDRTGLYGHYDIDLKWDGSSDGLQKALLDQLGLKLVPSEEPVAVRMLVLEKAPKPSVKPLNQSITVDIQPDGTVKYKTIVDQINRTGGVLLKDYLDGGQGFPIQNFFDETGAPVRFTVQPEATMLTLNKPVPPGEKYTLGVQVTIPKLCHATDDRGGFELVVDESCDDDAMHSIEEYRLPSGAVLLSEMSGQWKQTTEDGRIVLRIDRTIPIGGIRDVNLRYRLDTVVK